MQPPGCLSGAPIRCRSGTWAPCSHHSGAERRLHRLHADDLSSTVKRFSSGSTQPRKHAPHAWCFTWLAAPRCCLICSWEDLGDDFYAALEQRAETLAVAALHGGACAACGQALPHSSGSMQASDRAQEVLRSVLQVTSLCTPPLPDHCSAILMGRHSSRGCLECGMTHILCVPSCTGHGASAAAGGVRCGSRQQQL
jgi:hypothetical protein